MPSGGRTYGQVKVNKILQQVPHLAEQDHRRPVPAAATGELVSHFGGSAAPAPGGAGESLISRPNGGASCSSSTRPVEVGEGRA